MRAANHFKMFKLFIQFLLVFHVMEYCRSAMIGDSIPEPPPGLNHKDFKLLFSNKHNKTVFMVAKFGRLLQLVHLNDEFGEEFKLTEIEDGIIAEGKGQKITFKIVKTDKEFTLLKVSRTLKADQVVSDCFELGTGYVNWFGGPQQKKQYWPVEKLRLENYSYLTKEVDSVGLAERYWLHSKGAFVYVDETAPLFVDQNIKGNTLCLKVQNTLPYNTRRDQFEFVYYLGFAGNAKKAQQRAVEWFLHKPTALVDRRMVEHPIWSTWARYKRDINETTVNEFADEILKNGFNNSQFEIDDDWEVCYGALTFRESKFPNIKGLVDGLKAKGFRVTLWIHPFINKGCEPWYTEAKNNSFLAVDYQGNPDTQWWNSKKGEAAYIDFTNPTAAKWFEDRLQKLLDETGIDSFKFDAGESSWAPPDPQYNVAIEEHPNAITKTYIKTVAKFGPIVEVRSGQGTQDLPVFVRFIDKDSEWDYSNGLITLITTLLNFNLVGYGFVLPDMIGGNGYNGAPSEELFTRWLQANTFMPSLQFSYVPWDYSNQTIGISKKFTALHAQYTDAIMEAMQKNVDLGEPVNPPLWWLDPYDRVAWQIDDEYLLGDLILVAPIVQQGATKRQVYLPRGKWFDPNLNQNYRGPVWLNDYPAAIDVLPYFIREKPTPPPPPPK